METGRQPSHDFEFALLCLVPEVVPPKHRTGPTTQKRQRVKLLLRNSPTLGLGLPFVPTVHQERNNAHYHHQNRIAQYRVGRQKIDNGLPRQLKGRPIKTEFESKTLKLNCMPLPGFHLFSFAFVVPDA